MTMAVGSVREDYKLSPPGVELLVDAPEPARVDVGVPLGCSDAGVTEHLLDMPQIDTTGNQMGGEAVPQGVR